MMPLSRLSGRNARRGNVLFLILLAVVLFAALSYAVTSSMRGGGKDMSDENIRTGASVISQYVTLLRNEVQRLMLVNGCRVENLDWRHDHWKRFNGHFTYYNNVMGAPPSPKDGCAIFQAYGGAIAPQTFEKYSGAGHDALAQASNNSNAYGGHAVIRWMNRKNELTPANDIAIIFNGMNMALCSYLLDPALRPTVPNDAYVFTTNPNDPPPAPFTADADIVNEAINLSGDFFTYLAGYSGKSYCQLGAILLPQ